MTDFAGGTTFISPAGTRAPTTLARLKLARIPADIGGPGATGLSGQFAVCCPLFVIRTGRLDFRLLHDSFSGFKAPVAQLDRVYDFGS
jgi:hypothetical protein